MTDVLRCWRAASSSVDRCWLLQPVPANNWYSISSSERLAWKRQRRMSYCAVRPVQSIGHGRPRCNRHNGRGSPSPQSTTSPATSRWHGSEQDAEAQRVKSTITDRRRDSYSDCDSDRREMIAKELVAQIAAGSAEHTGRDCVTHWHRHLLESETSWKLYFSIRVIMIMRGVKAQRAGRRTSGAQVVGSTPGQAHW